MAAVSDARTVTSTQARKSLLKAFKVQRPLFLWGPPGIGKSELVYGEIMTFDQILKAVADVTSADIRALADEILHSAPTLAVVGPFPKRSIFERAMK